MHRYFQYTSYILRHKYFVFIECAKQGLIWRGLVHDLSKFRPSEFFPYAENFYGKKTPSKPKEKTDAFNWAWLHHISRNKHHWEFYVLGYDSEKKAPKVFDMPMRYRKEMLADWRGAGRAQGFTEKDECKNWYLKNKEKMVLSSNTREWIEKELEVND
jgi:hypothetical protein